MRNYFARGRKCLGDILLHREEVRALLIPVRLRSAVGTPEVVFTCGGYAVLPGEKAPYALARELGAMGLL